MKQILLSILVTGILLLSACGTPTTEESAPPIVDEPYYGADEVIAIVKQQLPDEMLSYHVVVDGKVVDKLKISGKDLRNELVSQWEAKYLGGGKWNVTCAINFVNWFDYEEPMNATGIFTWNFYEKSNTTEYIGYREITQGEFKLPSGE